MPTFKVDFIRAGDTLMVLSTENGIISSDVNHVERQMLSSPISGLLPIHIDEINFKVSFQYAITGKKMLSQCLKSDKLNLSHFYSLLLQIITILEDSKNYMLTHDNYILEEDYIFVEGSLSCAVLYLTYVPLNFPKEIKKTQQNIQQTIQHKFLSLVTSLLSHVQNMEGNGVQQLLALCKDEIFSFQQCKKLLLSLLTDEVPDERPFKAYRPDKSDKESQSHQPLQGGFIDQQPPFRFSSSAPAQNQNVVAPVESPLFNQQDQRRIQVSASLTSNDEEDSQSLRIKPMYILIGIVIVDALWWRFVYLNHQGKVNLYISIGVTILLGVAYWILTSKNIFTSKKENEFEQQWRWNNNSNGSSENQSYLGLVNEAKLNNNPTTLNNREVNELTLNDKKLLGNNPAENSFLQKNNQSNLPVQSPPTVLLHHDSNPTQRYLERYGIEGGTPEKIVLDRRHFIIGRDSKLAQYIEQVSGVSRAHVELNLTSDHCTLKDLGSKNGTKLNSEWIAPYKEYPIQVGESFVIAGVTFKYCIS
ncbi:hypothetical protein J2Z32_000049 [Paenibacillus turicensis]|uniref:FHA domain-containing protein n=1 Tax=Paenibacillus turicensis TaxID=160487 RepID=A0ABS4FLH8_9BACL|nr:DUF6382 domain-containing protein [Paenibacillus turicensis]MBP1903437.1 hypothetical protein [Paenibacillus turicensis]